VNVINKKTDLLSVFLCLKYTGILEYWNTGILEYWNTGILEYWNRACCKALIKLNKLITKKHSPLKL
jgi:hypothetical protein